MKYSVTLTLTKQEQVLLWLFGGLDRPLSMAELKHHSPESLRAALDVLLAVLLRCEIVAGPDDRGDYRLTSDGQALADRIMDDARPTGEP